MARLLCRAVIWLLLALVLTTLCTLNAQADPVPKHTRGRRHLKIPRLSKHSPQDEEKPQPQQAEASSTTQADQVEEEKPEKPKRERVFGAT